MAVDTIYSTVRDYTIAGICFAGEEPLSSVARIILNKDNTVVLDTDASGNVRFPSTKTVTFTGAQGRLVATTEITEHLLTLTTGEVSNSGANVLALQSLSTSKFSAVRALASNGDEKSAWGYGNSAVTPASLRGWTFNETSDPVNQANAGGFVITQSSTYGAITYDIRPRMGLLQDGTFAYAIRSNNSALDAANLLVAFDHSLPYIRLGANQAGLYYGQIGVFDGGHRIVFKDGEASILAYYAIGGTAAAGLGHEFKTNSTRRLLIADNLSLFTHGIAFTPQALSGAGAVDIITATTHFTSTGAAQALTLANGTVGQRKTIVHTVDGGSGVLTPTTALGYTNITVTNAGESATLEYTAAGWAIISLRGAVAA